MRWHPSLKSGRTPIMRAAKHKVRATEGTPVAFAHMSTDVQIRRVDCCFLPSRAAHEILLERAVKGHRGRIHSILACAAGVPSLSGWHLLLHALKRCPSSCKMSSVLRRMGQPLLRSREGCKDIIYTQQRRRFASGMCIFACLGPIKAPLDMFQICRTKPI